MGKEREKKIKMEIGKRKNFMSGLFTCGRFQAGKAQLKEPGGLGHP
jgi:hypothetical protein